MRPPAGRHAWGVLAALVVLLSAPVVQAEDTLVARLPLALDGDVVAHADQAILSVGASNAGEVPQLSLMFTAAEARVLVTNWTESDSAGCRTTVGGLLCDRSGGSEPLSPEALRDAEFRINDLDEDFLFLAMDGAARGANYSAQPLETPADLDITSRETTLSYTDTPRGLDFVRPLPRDTFALTDSGMRYEVTGDFTFMLHGGELTTLTAERTYTYDTGTWEQETTAGDVHIATDRTTQYVVVEVKDAVLTLMASGGQQTLYAGLDHLVIDVDGGISADAAAGTLQIGDDVVRSKGDRVRADGTFRLTPTYVVPASSKQVVFVMEGEVRALAVGSQEYRVEPAAVVVAVTGVGLLLAGLGAYFSNSLKMGLVVPLYAKLTKDKVLDQETRSLIHAKVEQDPGCQVKQVAESLDVSWTTAAYHLRVLNKMGLIVARRNGRHEHYFVNGSRAVAGHAVMAALQNDTARRITEIVLRNPGIIQKDLCDRLGIAPSTASGHLTKLRDLDIIREEREWKMRRYYVGAALDDVPLLGVTQHTQATEVPAPA